jgi:hypothetical protein
MKKLTTINVSPSIMAIIEKLIGFIEVNSINLSRAYAQKLIIMINNANNSNNWPINRINQNYWLFWLLLELNVMIFMIVYN